MYVFRSIIDGKYLNVDFETFDKNVKGKDVYKVRDRRIADSICKMFCNQIIVEEVKDKNDKNDDSE